MKSKIAHDIKHRLIPNDDFETPEELARYCILDVPLMVGDKVLDNARGSGVFYNNFPSYVEKDYCEIKEGKDFLNYNKKVDWIVTNPPYSNLDEWLKKSCELSNKGFAYLIGIHNLTPRRIELCEKEGFGIKSIHLCKVFKWFGITAFIVWEKYKTGIIKYDRVVWR